MISFLSPAHPQCRLSHLLSNGGTYSLSPWILAGRTPLLGTTKCGRNDASWHPNRLAFLGHSLSGKPHTGSPATLRFLYWESHTVDVPVNSPTELPAISHSQLPAMCCSISDIQPRGAFTCPEAQVNIWLWPHKRVEWEWPSTTLSKFMSHRIKSKIKSLFETTTFWGNWLLGVLNQPTSPCSLLHTLPAAWWLTHSSCSVNSFN